MNLGKEKRTYNQNAKKARAESTDAKYRRKRSLLQLIEDVEKRVAVAKDEGRRSQLERYLSMLMDELTSE